MFVNVKETTLVKIEEKERHENVVEKMWIKISTIGGKWRLSLSQVKQLLGLGEI